MRQSDINWKYALGEILLIFIGISLSLMFDQWRTTKSNRAKETELLNLLTESVKNDVDDLENKVKESTKTLNAVSYLIANLKSPSEFNDSISVAFSMIGYNPQFNPDMLGYNTLLTEGLSIISDHEVRKAIIGYYGAVENNVKWGAGVQKHIEDYVSPRIITDFDEYNFLEKGIPFDYKKLKSDKIFINILKKIERLNIVSLERLKDQKKYSETFFKNLNEL